MDMVDAGHGPSIHPGPVCKALYQARPGAEKEMKAAGGLRRVCEESGVLRYMADGSGGKIMLAEAGGGVGESYESTEAIHDECLEELNEASEAYPTHGVGMGHDSAQLYEVHDKLVSVLVKILETTPDAGTAIPASRLCETLYREHPGAKKDLASAGGIRSICEVSNVLMYVEDGGGGKVQLDIESDLFKITGRVTSVSTNRFFMESSIGNSNVYVPGKVLYGRVVEKGQVATVLATRDEKKGNWRGCWILSESSGAPGVHRMGRRMDKGAQAASSSSSLVQSQARDLGDDVVSSSISRSDGGMTPSLSVADDEEVLVQQIVGIITECHASQGEVQFTGMPASAVCLALYKQRPEAKQQIGESGGIKSLCAKYPGVLNFVPDGGNGRVNLSGSVSRGGATDAAQQDPGKVVSRRIVDIIRRNACDGCELSCTDACETLFREFPDSKRVIKDAGGMRPFCQAHADELTWMEGDTVKVVVRSVVKTGLVNYATERAYVLKTPSNRTVKVDKRLLGPAKQLKVGDKLSVMAVPQLSGNCDFKATGLHVAIPQPPALDAPRQTASRALPPKESRDGFEVVVSDGRQGAAGRVAKKDSASIRVSNLFQGLQSEEPNGLPEPAESELVGECGPAAKDDAADTGGEGQNVRSTSAFNDLFSPDAEDLHPTVLVQVGATAVMRGRMGGGGVIFGLDSRDRFSWRGDGPPAEGEAVTFLAVLNDGGFDAILAVDDLEAELWATLWRQRQIKWTHPAKHVSVIDFAKQKAPMERAKTWPSVVKSLSRRLVSFAMRTCLRVGDFELLAHLTEPPIGLESWTRSSVIEWLELGWVGFVNDERWLLDVLDSDEAREHPLVEHERSECFADLITNSMIAIAHCLLGGDGHLSSTAAKKSKKDFAFLSQFAVQVLSVPANSSEFKKAYSLGAVQRMASLEEMTGVFGSSRTNSLVVAGRAARLDLVVFLAETPSAGGWSDALHSLCTNVGELPTGDMTTDAPSELVSSWCKIISFLIERSGAKVLERELSGKLLFNLAAECGLRKELCLMLLPSKNIVKAMNIALSRDPPLNRFELSELAERVPREDVFSVQLECLLGKDAAGDARPGAAAASLPAILDLLLQRAGCEGPESRPEILRLLQVAIDSHDWKAVEVLLKQAPGQSIEGSKILIHEAASAGNVAILTQLLKHGADCNLRDSKRGQTPLHRACTAPVNVAKEMVKCLLDGGADAQIKDSKQLTPVGLLNKTECIGRLPNTIREAMKNILNRKANTTATSPHSSSPTKASGGARAQKMVDDDHIKTTASVPRAVVAAQGEEGSVRTVAAAGVKESRMAIKEKAILSESELVINVYDKICSYSATAHRPREIASHGVFPFQPSVDAESIPASRQQGAPATLPTAAVDPVRLGADAVMQGDDPAQVEAPARCAAAPVEPTEELVVDLSDAVWDLRFTRTFKEQLFALHSQPSLQRGIIQRLKQLAAGEQGGGLMKKLKGGNLGTVALNIFESPLKTFHDGPRFLWQYAVDYSPRIGAFTDTIRLWMIVLDHDSVSKGVAYIVESHRRGRTSSLRSLLKPCSGGSLLDKGRRIPRTYMPGDGDAQSILELEEIQFKSMLEHQESSDDEQPEGEEEGVVVYTPPAVSSHDSFNVLKFYSLSNEVVHSVITRQALAFGSGAVAGSHGAAASTHLMPEFPFIPDSREHTIITSTTKSPILLVGRSGTGKTSIAVGRMWELFRRWHVSMGSSHVAALAAEDDEVHAYNQIFVTANTVLRDQVRKSFRGMKEGFMGADAGHVLQEACYPPTFARVPSSMFPLFLTQNEFLRMLDGTLEEPFFPRNPDGSMKYRADGLREEEGALESLPGEGDEWFLEDDDDDEHLGEGGRAAEGEDGVFGGRGDHMPQWSRREVDFALFERDIWPKIKASRVADTKDLSAAALWTEITSYIKGSYAALDTSRGYLLKEEYLRLPWKMAPTFDGIQNHESVEDVRGDRKGTRDLIYDLFVMYEDLKKKSGYYDISDVCWHIFTQLRKTPYSGVKLHSMYIDETQDFTQAELRIFIEVCACKTDMFFSGDTCQTISSGVGFRFEDLKVLFQHVKLAEPTGTLQKIEVPEVQSMRLNYRTHNGILSLAASIVDLLEEFFPMTLDKLPRETGYFRGPKPILLTETRPESATIMIVGSNKEDSQIEFGASQVILVRTQEAKSRLPEEFDGCLAMTVLEAKGLEFDTVSNS